MMLSRSRSATQFATFCLFATLVASAGCSDSEDSGGPAQSYTPKNLVALLKNDGNFDTSYWENLTAPSGTRLIQEAGVLRPGQELVRTVTLTVAESYTFEWRMKSSGTFGGGGGADGSFGINPADCSAARLEVKVTARSDGTILGPSGGGASGQFVC